MLLLDSMTFSDSSSYNIQDVFEIEVEMEPAVRRTSLKILALLSSHQLFEVFPVTGVAATADVGSLVGAAEV
jgi:hypothetical protein